MKVSTTFIQQHQYELLLVALIQHLFIGIFLHDQLLYMRVIWPINMVILGLASVGVFSQKGKLKNQIKNLLFVIVVALPISLSFLAGTPYFMEWLSGLYVLFFGFIFWEIIRFLIRPSYINADIIVASACGYLLLIEISVFLMQTFVYNNPLCFKGIDMTNTATAYIDLVYFCSITITSIGFGDITPSAPNTKLLTSVFGIAGQFYSVVLLGILISKFTANQAR